MKRVISVMLSIAILLITSVDALAVSPSTGNDNIIIIEHVKESVISDENV